MSPTDLEVFKRNLLFQTVADSLVPQALEAAITDSCSDPNWLATIMWWSATELIHSASYSHILRGLFDDPSQIFDEIVQHRPIIERFMPFIDAYEDAADSDDGIKTLTALTQSLCLEGIAFFISFAVSYSLADKYQQAFSGTRKIIQLIQFDEQIHTQIGARLLRLTIDNPDEASLDQHQVDEFVKTKLYGIIDQYIQSEYDYLEYIVASGLKAKMLLDKENSRNFVNWRASVVLKLLRLPIPDKYQYDPQNEMIMWFKVASKPENAAGALQETDNANYRVESMERDW